MVAPQTEIRASPKPRIIIKLNLLGYGYRLSKGKGKDKGQVTSLIVQETPQNETRLQPP